MVESCAERLSSGRARRLLTLRQAGSAEPLVVRREEGPEVNGQHRLLAPDDDATDLSSDEEAAVNQSIGLEIRRPHGDEPHRLLFAQPYVVIGRSEACDLQLPHPSVSSRHAYLQRIDDRVMCVDLGSQTGTRWNNYAKIRDWMGAGDLVSIGPYEIGLAADCLEDESAEDRPAAAAGPPALPRVLLKVLRPNPRSGQQLVWPLRNSMNLIGRGRNCNIRVEHDSVSPAHCSLVLTSRGVWILDLLSEPGTLVNGQRVRYTRLRSGNELQIGNVLFRVMLEGEPVPARNGKPTAKGAAAESSGEVRSPVVRRRAKSRKGAEGGPLSHLPGFDRVAKTVAANALSAAGEFSPPARGEFSEEFVLSLMNQFAAMQMQQMNMMSEIFMGMQERYLEFIREDLRRVQELTAELQRLQSELLRQSTASAALSAPAAPRAGSIGAAPPEPDENETDENETDENETDDSPAAAAQAEPAAVAEGPAQSRADAPADGVGPESRPRPEQARGPRHSAPPQSEVDSDDQYQWLLQRISQVERERSSRWKNILQTLSGAGRDR